MSWLTLTVDANATDADRLSESLLDLGAISVDVHDADAGTEGEKAIFGEPGELVASMWAHSRITALFPADTVPEGVMNQAAQSAGLMNLPAYQVSILEDDDWVRRTQSQFRPICISRRLWIVPTWHKPEDPEAINIELDPGLAFGTGSHPTTRLCLRWLDTNIQGGETVLDYGCGSGILAIAALKLGAASAIGVDLDPQAIQAGIYNAAANKVPAQFYLPDEMPQIKADIVVANILTNPLKLLAPLIAQHVRSGGKVALSGILNSQAGEVIDVYTQWFDLESPIEEDGWVCLSGVRR